MLRKNRLTLAVSAAIGLTTVGMMPSVANAQDELIEEVVVTGSRISRPDLEGANPITVLKREDINMQGFNNVGDVLRNITASAGAATNTNVNNGGEGRTTFSLRGLGSQRTLILLNGQRVVASGLGADDAVDLGNIPTAMIERVEVLKDGASAVYGSDAIAGVVNIITRRNFEGFELNAYHGEYGEGDGQQQSMDFTMGVNGDRGNAVVSGWWNDSETVWAGDRSYSENDYWWKPYWDPTNQRVAGGSSAPPWGNHADPTTGDRYTRGEEGGDWRPRTSADGYNYQPVNYLATPNQRWGINFAGAFEFGDVGVVKNLAFTTDAFYSHSESETLSAPEPLAPLVFFGVAAPYSADNYYNQQFGPKNAAGETFEIDDWRRRMVETGGRASNFQTDTYQLHVAINGDIGNWNWELAGGYGENDSTQYLSGYFNLDRVGDAVGPTHFNAEGALQCGATPEDLIAGCVPLNVFGLPGGENQVTQEMLKYVSTDYNSFTNGKNELKSVTFATSNSEVFSLPAGPVGIALGLEKHWFAGSQVVDTQQLLGSSTAGVSQNTGGEYDVNEAFIEVNIPLLADIPAIQSLELNVATRYSDYSTYGDTVNSKLNLRWVVTDGLTFRGTAGESFRAPSIPELYEGQFRTFPVAVDPCGTDANANCIANGVPVGGYDNGGVTQIPSDQGGNPTLEEETAETITFGLVYEPSWWDNSSLTLDYWDIDIENPVTVVGTQNRLTGCHDTGIYCDSIERFGLDTSVAGNIITVVDLNDNAGRIETSGIDASLNAELADTRFGIFGLGLDYSYLLEYDKTLATGAVQEHAGQYWDNNGNDFGDGMYAEHKVMMNLTWMMNDWSGSWRTHYTSGVTEDLTGLWWHQGPGENITSRNIDSYMTHDAQVQYNFSQWNTRISIGADNVFDEEPPFIDSAFAYNTDHTYPGSLGRFFYGRVTLSF